MMRSRTATASSILLVATLLLLAAPALARADDSGTIYGTAKMSSTLSISISGRGSAADNVLPYFGDPGATDVYPSPDNQDWPVIENNGNTDISGLTLEAGTAPGTWQFGNAVAASTCVWAFRAAFMTNDTENWLPLLTTPQTLPAGTQDLAVDTHWTLYAMFSFPQEYTTGDTLQMTALVMPEE